MNQFVTHHERLSSYLLCIVKQLHGDADALPDWVPCQVCLLSAIPKTSARPELPAGEYPCETTVRGSIVIPLRAAGHEVRYGVLIKDVEIYELGWNRKKDLLKEASA